MEGNSHGAFVVGTAGHIDHGKSTLVRALTGIDPDRLAEEKRRGMTIDLGFAHLALPSGRTAGIVDVPGHARFIRNMLAGVHGLDAVLLVVAADEGVMPQTVEHLEIVDLLQVSRGIAVVTKRDLVEADWLDLVVEEVREAISKTSMAAAEVVTVSATTGDGLPELVSQLDALLAAVPPRADLGRPRLPVDRVFTVSGFGTVVTGTLVDGWLSVGDELEVMPGGSRVRIRGLQQHGSQVERAAPGSRTAVNLAGVEKQELERGHVLARRGTLASTRRADARVRVLADAPRPLRHGADLILHTGTVEVPVRAIVLEADELAPSAEGWIQLYLERPAALAAGDRFVLRVPTPSATLAGGAFADVAARRHPRHDSAVTAGLERRAAGDVLAEELRKYPRGITEAALRRATLTEPSEWDRLRARRAGEWLFAPEAWKAVDARATASLADFHRRNPLRGGMPREELKSRLGLSTPAFAAVVAALAAAGALVERGAEVAAPDHAVQLDSGGGPAARVLELLAAQPWAPPSLPDVLRESGASPAVVRALAEAGQLVRLSEDMAFTRDAYERALTVVREIIERDGQVTVGSLRDAMGSARRPVLALLEYTDSQRITRRLGDARVLR